MNAIPRLILLATLCSAAGARGAFDLQRPPTAQDVQAIRAGGWAASADALEEQMVLAYRPAHVAQVGSTGNQAFRQWQLLYQWSRLLGQTEPDALRAYLGRRVLIDPEKDNALLIVPPGLALPSDRSGRPLPTAADHLDVKRVPPEILQALLPDDYTPQAGPVSARAKEDFLAQLAGDQEFLRQFFGLLSPDDFPPVALTRLEQIYSAHPQRWAAYRSLMLAFALVYDQRAPSFWPHHQVDAAAIPAMDENLAGRFDYYVRANEAGRLEHDLRRLDAAELKFLVDAPVARAELEWAAKNVRPRREQFERVLDMVTYDHRRVEKGVFTWPHGSYRLGNIELMGGICTDQAYFACIAGKAKGISTLYFAGQGTDGGHAWFGFLGGNRKWQLDAGRFQNQNYSVGQALDPQTWLPISDHELQYLSGAATKAPAQDAALGDLVMADVFARRGMTSQQLAAAESALHQAPRLLVAWEAKETALMAAAGPEQLRAFYASAIDFFRREEDLRVRYQARLAGLERDGGDAATAQKLEARMVRENRSERADLSVAAGAESLTALLRSGDYDGAMREYRSLATKIGRTGGGNFFYGVVRPFVLELRAAGKAKEAERALELARRAMTFEADSIIAREFSELEKGDAARGQ